MSELAWLVTMLLSTVGLTVLIVWPQNGPTAWLRERVLRRMLPASAAGALDCYICFSFWAGMLLSPLFWRLCEQHWVWFNALATPALFWVTLFGRPASPGTPGNSDHSGDTDD
ncbi:MAG: hypothetical protein GC159_17765 [Phycisphaera sp.]|nr:hypothetical protein [Phycisphaera sp.]